MFYTLCYIFKAFSLILFRRALLFGAFSFFFFFTFVFTLLKSINIYLAGKTQQRFWKFEAVAVRHDLSF